MKKLFGLLFLAAVINVSAQKQKLVVAGPMVGHTELRTSTIWVQFADEVKSATIYYIEKQIADKKATAINMLLSGGWFNTATAVLTGLEPGKTYSYYIKTGNSAEPAAKGEITTQQLWQWRKPAPDFSFLTGSCAYFNEPQYDRPGKPYGWDSSIFEPMAKEKADFMLWLGDNWYTREADYYSAWGLNYRASRDRGLPIIQNFLKAMPQYAIWDDHDYGPNDADESYILKDESRNVFMKYWANPSYGMNGQGIYTKVSWNDVDVFMLDDRWYRSDDGMPDSINGQPNPGKKMLGDVQMEWLKTALVQSNGNTLINFRIIAVGSQVLNPYSPYDCFHHFPKEYNELMDFIAANKIKGIVFVTGDRHHSEVIKAERPGSYTLYDITASPFTSGIGKTRGAEINNPVRVGAEIDEQNYARFTFSGKPKERKLTVNFVGLHGETLSEWSIMAADLTDK
ncbi:MAG TPA: alkaline phosphatase D family protein [Panacibacter sp.]|nr:alkaline phosphatase D family protein [Panacibacter sp.]